MYDFLIKKLEKEDISLMAIYEVFIQRYDFEDLAESLLIMFQSLGNEEEEVNLEANQNLVEGQSGILYTYKDQFTSNSYRRLLDWIKMGDLTVKEYHQKYIKSIPKDEKKFVESLMDYAKKRGDRKSDLAKVS